MENKEWIKLIEEKRQEIIKSSKECYRQTMDGSCFQGWNVGIILSKTGNTRSFYWSTGDTSTDIIDGTSIKVINYIVDNEAPEIIIDEDDIAKEELAKFQKWCKNEEYDNNEYSLSEMLEQHFYDFCEETKSNIYKKMVEEAIDFEVDNTYREIADEEIDQLLSRLEMEDEFN